MTDLRTISGQPPLGIGGLAFRDDQGEWLEHDNPRYRSPATRIGVLALDGGTWLAHPPGFRVDGKQHASRDTALRAGIAAMVRRARKNMRKKEGEGTHWNKGYAGRVIDWALSLKPAKAKRPWVEGEPEECDGSAWDRLPPAVKAGDALDQQTYAAIDAGATISDPVVAALVEAHSLRKQFPAAHTFAMTTEVADGRIVSVATCKCGQAIRFGSNDYVRMNAAIEAHWRRYPDGPMVDGRGDPIKPGDGARIAGSKPQKRKKSSDGRTDEAMAREPVAAVGGAEPGRSPGPRRDDVQAGVGSERSSPSEQQSAPSPVEGAGLLNPNPPWHSAAHEAWLTTDEGQRFNALRQVANGWWEEVSTEALRDLVDVGYTHATATDVLVTEEGQAWLDAMQVKFSSDGGGESGPAESPLTPDAKIIVGSPERRLQSGAGVAPSPSETNTNIADQAPTQIPDGLRSEPAPAVPPAGAGSPLQSSDEYLAGIVAKCQREAAPIGAASESVVTSPDDVSPEWSELLQAAASLAWDDNSPAAPLHSYDQFLCDKVVTAPLRGIEVDRNDLSHYLKPHCKDLVVWALRLGCAAIFASFGLHKTAMQLEWCRQLQRRSGGATLSVLPLGVRHGFIKEAVNLGMAVRFIRTNEEYHLGRAEGIVHFLTNYESIRDGKLDPNLFSACSLDEASVLRSYGSKTFQEFLPLFGKVAFKLVATATPSPNRYKELIHYSGFLGVMDTGLALTRFFQRNSEKAGDLTLYPHKEDEFWMWVHSWAAFLQKPSELGYSDEGYELPPLQIRWHEVPADHTQAEPERDGQAVLFRKGASSLQDAARARRDSLPARIAKMAELLAQDPESHRILWHDLEAEREAIEQAVPGVVAITGSGMELEEREQRLADFEEGRTKYFATKPILSGSGSNFQYHCHKAIYVGLPGDGYKFNDWIQSIYRLQRFGQQHPVEIDIIYAEDMRAGRAALEEKWALDTAMRARMSEIIAAHGLNTLPLRDALLRTMQIRRVEERGENFQAINNDAVLECRTWPTASVDLIVTSIPFSNHYEYSASYRDFGHTDDNGHFWAQMDFLTCELLRMLQPGRLACIHVKDRILFGSVTGQGVPTVSPFHAEAIGHYRGHGFQYLGMITVVTDVVRENNQTYRLGWSENAKDSTKMGVGSPEYVLLFRKPQSDRTRSYADVPVEKSKDDYTRARWQIDAHGFWRSSGDRLLTAEEFASLDAADHAKLFSKISTERVYDYEAHVAIGERLEAQGALPATFMAIAPGSHDPEVWSDINRMRMLNMMQQRKGAEMHLCLARGSLVLTRGGYKPIEDVDLGEEVLTHKGRWRPVIVKRNTGVRPVVTLRAHGVSGLTLTPDHKLWTRKIRDLPWSVAHSRKEARRTAPDWVRADETRNSYVNLKLPPAEMSSVEGLRHWWAVGRWLADGHFSRKARSYVISCGHHEVDFMIEQLGPYGGNKPHDSGTAVQIILKDADRSLRQTLELCGHGAAGKHLPPEAFTLPVAQARALLDGYLSGDGHWLPQRNRWMATSVSRELLLGIAMLAQRAYDAIASIYPGRPAGQATIDGRVVNTLQEWVLSFDVTTDGRRKGKPFILDDGAWRKVRSIEPAGEAETWCLRVAEDESFTAEGCIVKNCPLQFDIVDRLIERYSNEGELVFDPFGGLMTVPYRALMKGRKGAATELSTTYFADGVKYLRQAEEKMAVPALFDLAAFDAANSPPPQRCASDGG